MELHAGEGLFSALLAVVLISVFMAALAHSYQVSSERKGMLDDFELALDIAEQIRGRVLSSERGRPGLVEVSPSRIENYSRVLGLNGIGLKVEIATFGGEPLLAISSGADLLDNRPPSAGVSFPVVAICENGSLRLCKLVVSVWRD